MTDFLAFAERYGLVVALLVAAVVASATGIWFSRPMVEKIQAGFERLLLAKEEDFKRLLESKDKELDYRERLLTAKDGEIVRLRDENARLTALLLESQTAAEQFADIAAAPRVSVASRRAR